MKLILLFCFCINLLTSSAQDKNKFYALDASLNETVLDSSKYILWVHEKEDSNWQFDYYKTWGPLVKTQTFADRQGTVLNGRSSFYTTIGNLDSTGIFDRGKKNGNFYKFKSISNDSIVLLRKYKYDQDSLVIFMEPLKDSSKKQGKDTTDAEYPGGLPGWYSYLNNNLKYPDRARDKLIQGTVWVRFTVDSTGEIKNPHIEKSVEYSIDQEAMDIIKNSGKWVPATIDGMPVRSFKKQPLKFGFKSAQP
jgi:protein TonB